jgi:ubiquinone/menaquinone biosynthesis C-methylase UbiE
MLSLVPSPGHRVLDVACGMGATTRWLATRLPHADITGVNLSARQLARCAVNAPSAGFIRGDANALPIRTGSMDLVLCVEAMPHFSDRGAFLAEAQRVLAPGGWLVSSDALFGGTWGRLSRAGGESWDREYAAAYRRAGFAAVRVVDVTPATWERFDRYAAEWGRRQRKAGAIGLLDFTRVMAGPAIARLTLRRYVLAAAQA